MIQLIWFAIVYPWKKSKKKNGRLTIFTFSGINVWYLWKVSPFICWSCYDGSSIRRCGTSRGSNFDDSLWCGSQNLRTSLLWSYFDIALFRTIEVITNIIKLPPNFWHQHSEKLIDFKNSAVSFGWKRTSSSCITQKARIIMALLKIITQKWKDYHTKIFWNEVGHTFYLVISYIV